MPLTHRGLLDRIDALAALVADRHGLALLPDGRLAAAEARVAIRATEVAPPGGSGVRASTVTQLRFTTREADAGSSRQP